MRTLYTAEWFSQNRRSRCLPKGRCSLSKLPGFRKPFLVAGACSLVHCTRTLCLLASLESDSVGDQAATFLGAWCLVAAVLGHCWTFPSWRPCFLLRCVVPVAHWLPTSANRPTRQSKAPPTPLGDLLKRPLSVNLNQPVAEKKTKIGIGRRLKWGHGWTENVLPAF